MNYYSAPQSWKLPKWIGALLGGAFAVIAVGSAWAIVVLTHSTAAGAAVVAALPAPAASPSTAPSTAPSPASSPVVAAPAASSAPSVVAPAELVAAPSPRHHAKKKSVKLAKRSHHLSPAKKRAVLAKHDSKSGRKSKNDLDRLLGL